MFGDAIHNLSDVSTSAVVFLGFRLSRRAVRETYRIPSTGAPGAPRRQPKCETADFGCENKGVSPTPAQQAQAARIAALGFTLPGTLADRMARCGYATRFGSPPRFSR
jgi:hypothetical protein